MPWLPPPIESLVTALSQLPGIGPRSAERIALHVVQADAETIRGLAQALITARKEVGLCQRCGALTQQQPCAICTDPKRDATLVCIVERPVDLISIEKSTVYHGRYHVLGGKISPLNGIGPEDLRIAELESRLSQEPIAEVILALPSDVEGDATGFFLAQQLLPKGVKVTRIAQGLPVGGGLEFADELTLSRAMEGRRAMER